MKSPKACISIILLISLCTCQFEIPINFERNDDMMKRNQIYLQRFARHKSLDEFKDDPDNSDLVFNPEVNLEELYEEYQNTNRKIQFLSQNIENSNDTQFSTIPQKSSFLTLNATFNNSMGNQFRLAIDSSHTETWVPSENCSNCDFKTKLDTFDTPINQSKYELNREGSLYLEGNIYKGILSLEKAYARDQIFLATDYVGFYKNYATMNFDGILALGHQSKGFDGKYNTFLTNLKIKKVIDYLSYSIDLKLNKLAFGQKNVVKYFSDKIYYFKVESNSTGWVFTANIVINYGPNNLKLTTGIVESAIGYISLNPKNFDAISNYLNLQNNTCDISTSGNIEILLNNFKIDLPKDDYIYKVENFCQLRFLSNDNVDINTIVLGLPALNNRFTIFDAENQLIGFSSSNHRFGSIAIWVILGLLFYLLKF